ncbi:MAG: helix-turn-helix domain-containing protein [Nitrospirae bacterium]|nr:helix-turn-helix domain-containing protein [Nitrospirota bacterium]
MQKLIRPPDLAEKLGLKVSTVYKWVYLKKFPVGAVVKLGRALRFREEVIQKIMDGALRIGGKE